ncbi:hypothetical protein OQ252_11970 [Acetobacter farinalis]|uniref:Cardiolipin synthase N-terminal domain-containing protein n=1 Tax=Acetobacter farinalis TaxID=1260984 RepID=A0ABT3Q9Z0_9PROT|nr:hypothetical protein [Acetobacter farinalis]MCX2562106.1 hypothetical protein [Acetobacter farinalis]NHO30722.1 hypothetical protein [Acetobacter farinalis]
MPENSVGQKIGIGVLSLLLAMAMLAGCVFLGGKAAYLLLHPEKWAALGRMGWLLVAPLGVVLYFRLRKRTRRQGSGQDDSLRGF